MFFLYPLFFLDKQCFILIRRYLMVSWHILLYDVGNGYDETEFLYYNLIHDSTSISCDLSRLPHISLTTKKGNHD